MSHTILGICKNAHSLWLKMKVSGIILQLSCIGHRKKVNKMIEFFIDLEARNAYHYNAYSTSI